MYVCLVVDVEVVKSELRRVGIFEEIKKILFKCVWVFIFDVFYDSVGVLWLFVDWLIILLYRSYWNVSCLIL